MLFFPFMFFNIDGSFNLKDKLLKFSVVDIGITLEGTHEEIYIKKIIVKNYIF